jgi:uncharacterized membrane protein YhhN
MVALTIACVAACGVLVFAEWRRLASLRAVAKIGASLAFLAVGVLARSPGPYGAWMLAGLALGAVGDVALLGDGKRAFLVGLGAFLLGHIAYVVGIAQLVSPREWLGPLAALPIAVAIGVLAHLWPRLGAMRGPVILYVAAIATMVVGALAAREHTQLVVGAVLFFASDYAVARDKFIAKELVTKAWGLPAYYAGQLLIAWSLAF